jgi:hypothetical protein
MFFHGTMRHRQRLVYLSISEKRAKALFMDLVLMEFSSRDIEV